MSILRYTYYYLNRLHVYRLLDAVSESICLFARRKTKVEYCNFKLYDLSIYNKDPDFFIVAEKSLDLIDKVDPLKFKKVQKNIHIITNEESPFAAQYRHFLRICSVDYGEIRSAVSDMDLRIKIIATLIVHEAFHGELHNKKMPSNKYTRERIELLCIRRANEFFCKMEKEDRRELNMDNLLEGHERIWKLSFIGKLKLIHQKLKKCKAAGAMPRK